MSFAYPKLLILLLAVPFTAVVAFIGWHLRRTRWQEFVAPRLRGRLLQGAHPFRHWFALTCLLLAATLLCIALARPRKMTGVEQTIIRSHDIVFALDLSKSMLVSDVKPDRLAQAKALIYEMSEAMPDDRVALVGFAGTAHLFTPLTVDHGALRETLDQLDPFWIPTGGSDLAAGVTFGIDTLKQSGSKTSALIVLSDGEENEGSASRLIDQANREGVRIITIGLGTSGGGPVPLVTEDRDGMNHGQFQIDRAGNRVISKLEAGVLKKLADGTHGKYIAASEGSIPQLVRALVDTLAAQERDQQERLIYQEYFAWFVAPAAVLILCAILGSTRWTRAAVAAGVMMFAMPHPAQAAEPANAAAWQKEAQDALTRERAAGYQLGAGDAAYQAKDYSTAADAYSAAQLTDDAKVSAAARARLGNTLFQLGWQKFVDGPASDGKMPDLATFEQIAAKKLGEWFDPRNEDINGLGEFDTVIKNWTDAIRQYDSLNGADADDATSKHNRELSVRYLKKLREMLKQQQQMMQQAMPQKGKGKKQKGQPGEGDPQSGDGEEEGDEGEEEEEGSDAGEERDKDGKGGGDQEKDQNKGDQGDKDRRAGESAEDHAKRLLKDKADEAKKPLNGRGTQGGARQRPPAKDW